MPRINNFMKRAAVLAFFLLGISQVGNAGEQLTDQERSAVALLSSVMDIVSSKIEVAGCYEMRGQYHLQLVATGMVGQRRQNNMVTVDLPDHVVSVVAYLKNKVAEIGSQITTSYTRTSDYNVFDPVKEYDAVYGFNSTSELMSMVSDMTLYKDDSYVKTQAYHGSAITSFVFKVPPENDTTNPPTLGWGMGQLSTLDYPIEKYWQRMEIRRDEGENGRTVFVKDRLAFSQSCRIKTEIIGHNGVDLLSQEGSLTIDMSLPEDPIVIYFQ